MLQRESSLKSETTDNNSASKKNSPKPSVPNRKNLWKRPSDSEVGNNCKENSFRGENSSRSDTTDNDSAIKKNSPKPSVINRKTLRKRSSSISISLEKKIQVQNQRYRKRRHEVLSELLKSAGELLDLEDRNSGEYYIPLLDRLLLPPLFMKPMNSFDTDSGSVDGCSIDENGIDEICNDKLAGLNDYVLKSSPPGGDAAKLVQDDATASAHGITTSEFSDKSNNEFLGNDVDDDEPIQSNSDENKESIINVVTFCCEMDNDNNQCMQSGEVSDNNQYIQSGEVSIESIRKYNPYSRIDVLNSKLDEISSLRPIIESLTPGSGTRCLAIFLLRHLLQSKTGYDARIRHCIKILGVIIFLYDCTDDYIDEQQMKMDFGQYATKNFEAFERLIANHLLQLSNLSTKSDSVEKDRATGDSADLRTEKPNQTNRRRSNIIKGFQIGGAAVAAGVLFAVTAGMAAPAIAAGVAVIASATTITASAAALLTTHLAGKQ